MTKTAFSKIYAITLTVLFLVGEVLLFCSPAFSGIDGWIELLIGLALALILAPTVHEIGHLSFAYASGMEAVLVKFFCFKIQRQGGRYAFSLVSPFEAEQTQVVPKNGGNMQKRAQRYAIGGLIYSGAFFALFFVSALVLTCFGIYSAKLWGVAPYAGYLFLLNVAPFEYPSGKTDMLVYLGLRRGESVEKAMVMAMEVQGLAYAGVPYSEMGKEKFEFPVIAEDEPIFAVCAHLKYRLALDEEDYALASHALNRLAQSESYLSAFERERLAGEITYMHALGGNLSAANESAKYCEGYLKSKRLQAKRILSTVALVSGKVDEALLIKAQAENLLETEFILTERNLEEKLLSRLQFSEE